MNKVEEMWVFAKDKHYGQKYGHRDYIYHLEAVESKALHLNTAMCLGNTLVTIVSLGHDLIEDTYATYEQIPDLFGKTVSDAILALTKIKDESYEDYIEKVKSNKIALLVKKADTLCNLEESVKCGDARRVNKYSKQIVLLME